MKHLLIVFMLLSSVAFADEQLLGYVRSAETIPVKAWEVYQFMTSRDDKGNGVYHAINTTTEVEYGLTNSFNVGLGLQMMALNTHGLIIDGYLPKETRFDLKPIGLELEAKYNFLSPAMDDLGLSVQWSLDRLWIDPHSGQDKDTYSFETLLILQKYFMEGQLIWSGNIGLESTYADRKEIADLPSGFDWPTEPEMEIETKLGTGLSYRFMPGWYMGGEALYETEYETEVGRERFSLFAGPTIHYGGLKWWGTATYFSQFDGGGEKYTDQANQNLHLIEKTKNEVRIKLGFNF